MSEPRGQGGRLAFVDVAKGIAIILVVYGHAARGLVEASLQSGDLIGTIDYIIYVVHMPLFFMLSGLFFEHSLAKGPAEFWKSRFLTLVYPYFLWSVIQGTTQVILSGSGAINSPVGWGRLLEIGWAPISPFWFLYALFFANVLMAGLRRLPPSRILAVALLLFLVAQMTLGDGTLGDIAYGLLYFACGVAVNRWRLLERVPGSTMAFLGMLSAWLGLALGAQVMGLSDRLALPATAAGMMAILTVSVMIAARLSKASAALSFLGQCSMAIFVMHILAIGAARVGARLLGIDATPSLLLLLTLAGIAVPCGAQLIAARVGVSRAFGLPETTRIRSLARQPWGRLHSKT